MTRLARVHVLVAAAQLAPSGPLRAQATQAPPAAVVDLGQVCAGLPARGTALVDLSAPPRAAQRQIRAGSPATQLQLSLAPVAGESTLHRLDVVLQAARTGRIDRALALPGARGDAAGQVRLRASVVDCGVPARTTQQLAGFLEARPARDDGNAAPGSASGGGASPGEGPRARSASLEDRRRAALERRAWCEARRDPYDTLYAGSGFVPLPWLAQPGWVYVPDTYDQSAPADYTPAVWTRVRAVAYDALPRARQARGARVGHLRLDQLPRVAAVESYRIDDCRLRVWDDYFAWAAAHDSGKATGEAPGGALPAGAAAGTGGSGD